jgi:lysine 2,3-aminomutase
VPNITHRYPDRVLFLVSPVCATYCRFCTRRRKVGDPEKIPLNQYDSAFEYIRNHPEVRDVILSGGDPFMLSDRRIEYLLTNLRAIPHVEIIRIHTRMPSHLPERITPELMAIVKQHHPVFVNVHFNHPDELTPEAERALAMLADAGIPLGSQTVLLKGVNDEPQIMKRLMQLLVKNRVRPYYIYQADVVAGGEHFRTQFEKGLEIVRAIRGWTTGLCQPHFVIDAPGGGGKIPILPEYVESVSDEEVVLRNYAGEVYRYPLPQAPAIAAANRLVVLQGGVQSSPAANGRTGRPAKKTATGRSAKSTGARKTKATPPVAPPLADVVGLESLTGIVPIDV